MTKKDIVRVVSEELGLTQQQTKDVVQRTFDSIIETLVREGRIELRNFGVFEVKSRAARKARNPKTGQQVDVPQKSVVTFKPGKIMEQRVREFTGEVTDDWSAGPHQDQSSSATLKNDEAVSLSPSGRWDTTT
ncbi:MAG: HU family DNA-binding protein [Planctomycetota bacterium]